ncbi:MAG: hypothetical protein ABSE43_00750 [Steroidobacteraceae bacterium]|jgi:hypothetical protein
MNIFSPIDLARLFNFRVSCEGLFHKAAHLLFIIGVPFDRFHNQAVGGTARLLGKTT